MIKKIQVLPNQSVPSNVVYGRFALLWFASRPEIPDWTGPLDDLEGKDARYIQLTAQSAIMSIAYGGLELDSDLPRKLKKIALHSGFKLAHRQITSIRFWDFVDTLQMAWSQAGSRRPPRPCDVRILLQLSSPTKWAATIPIDAVIRTDKEGAEKDDRFLKRLRTKTLDIDLDVHAQEVSLYITGHKAK